MSVTKEVAKFASGAEAFHAIVHAVAGSTGTTLTVFGITAGPTWYILGVVVNAGIALLLGLFGWGLPAAVRRGPAAGAGAR